jgi:hypothetical protein
MKILAILLALMATVLAVPLEEKSSELAPRVFVKNPNGCPTSVIQPHGILPKGRTLSPKHVFEISRQRPAEYFLTDKWASITPRDKCTVFVIDFDASKARGKTCNLVFDFPTGKQGPGVSRMIGPGRFTFYPFRSSARPPIPNFTTWNTRPPPATAPPVSIKQLRPGHSYVLTTGPCYIPPEATGIITRSGMMCSENTSFQFKQSDERCPMGLYIIITEPDGSD